MSGPHRTLRRRHHADLVSAWLSMPLGCVVSRWQRRQAARATDARTRILEQIDAVLTELRAITCPVSATPGPACPPPERLVAYGSWLRTKLAEASEAAEPDGVQAWQLAVQRLAIGLTVLAVDRRRTPTRLEPLRAAAATAVTSALTPYHAQALVGRTRFTGRRRT